MLALAGELNRRQPGKVAVLYGAMPLASRRLEIERFMNGQATVCCATDVLGHGVNLPCETLLFAESQKFDGEERRDLHAWEIAQIAGRAGRFGLVERGHVGVLTGIVWANADPELIEAALHPDVPLPGGHVGYRVVDTARIRPRLEDLPIEDPAQLPAALRAWHSAALRQWATDGWLSVESIGPLLVRLDVVQRRLRERGRRLALEQVWKLVNAPVDEDNAELLGTLALAVSGDRAPRPVLQWLLDVEPAPRGIARGRRAGRTNGEHPPLVRAPVSGRRRRHAREGGRARGGRRRAASARSSRPRWAPRPSGAASSAARAARRGSRSANGALAGADRHGVDLYWLPLGAGGHFVRLNGRVYEALVARRDRRPRAAPLPLRTGDCSCQRAGS